MKTQSFRWIRVASVLASLEVRHHKSEIMLIVFGTPEKRAEVTKKMLELNKEGVFQNEASSLGNTAFAQFLVSFPPERWEEFIQIVNEMIGMDGVEYFPK